MSPRRKLVVLSLISVLGATLAGNPSTLLTASTTLLEAISGDTPLPTEIKIGESDSTKAGVSTGNRRSSPPVANVQPPAVAQISGNSIERLGGVEVQAPGPLFRDPCHAVVCVWTDDVNRLVVMAISDNDGLLS